MPLVLFWSSAGIVGSLIGDGIAQYAESRNKPRGAVSYDAGRASRLCAYAAVIGSPIGHYWFGFLDKVRTVSVPAITRHAHLMNS